MTTLSKKLLAVAPAVVALIVINYAVDPVNLFHDGCEGVLAESLLDGNRIAGSTINDRLLHKRIIERVTTPTDVIALGSSRGMEIRSAEFHNQTFFNHSVSAARLEDFLAIYQNYVARDLHPSSIVLELDPWILNENFDRRRWPTIEDDYRAMCRALGVRPRPSAVPLWVESRYAQLISPQYLRVSLRDWISNSGSLRRNCDPRGRPAELRGDPPVVQPDGSVVFPQAVLTRDRQKVRREARRYASANEPRFVRLDRDIQAELEAFVSFISRQEVQVVFLLVPYHPAAREGLRRNGRYSMIDSAEQYFRAIAQRYNLPIFGSYDPATSGCDETQFVDGIHPLESCFGTILRGWTTSHLGESSQGVIPGS